MNTSKKTSPITATFTALLAGVALSATSAFADVSPVQSSVRPLGLDRFGIRFRIEGPDGDNDVRLSFPRPVTDVQELSYALRGLAGCPFINSLPE